MTYSYIVVWVFSHIHKSMEHNIAHLLYTKYCMWFS